ncbi:MAG: cohesin domain-containing protein [Bacteroidota bacterium]
MKYFLPLFLSLFLVPLSAQTVDLCPAIPDQEFAAGESFSIQIQTTGFTDMVALQFTVAFDPTVLNLDGITADFGQTSNPAPGEVRYIFADIAQTGVTVIDGSNLLTLDFTAISAVAAPQITITDTPLPIEALAGEVVDGVVVAAETIDVSICGVPYVPPAGPVSLQLCPFGTVGPFAPGEQVEVFLNTTGFTNIQDLQFTISYSLIDFSFVSFQQATPIPGLTIEEPVQGQLAFVFETDVPEGLSLPDGPNNFSIILEVQEAVEVAQVAITEGAVPIQGSQLGNPDLDIRVCGANGGPTGSGAPDICLQYLPGPYSAGQQVEIDVIVHNFRDISLVDMPLSFDWSQLSFNGIASAGPVTSTTGVTWQESIEGLRLIWIDWIIAGTPLPDGSSIITFSLEVQEDMETLPVFIDPAMGLFVGSAAAGETPPEFVTVCEAAFVNGILANIVSRMRAAPAGCTVAEEAPGMPGWRLEVSDESGVLNFSTSAGAQGDGYLVLPTGDYTYEWIPPANPAAWSICPEGGSFSVAGEETVINIDGVANPALECSETYVRVSSTNFRPCFENNTFFLYYGNYGPEIAEAAYIDLTLSPSFTPLSSSLPYTELPNGDYRFELGDLTVGSTGNISIAGLIDCDLPVGSTLCATAKISPNGKNCLPAPVNFSGAELRATAECLGDEIQFSITNEGDGPTGMLDFVVVEDVVIYMENNLNLMPGATEYFSVPADGSTYRLELALPEDAPYETQALAIEEGCGTGPISLGFVTALPLLDGDLWLDRYCQETTAAYDPNDKQALPKGVGDNHLIAPNTSVDYKIRFQNTGNDTAFTVIIRDTIDTEVFDLNTLELGAASHDFFLRQTGDNALEFVFNNIQLPDSTIDEPNSHGYVHFSIDQLADLPDGTRLSNRAGIYFDFNPPIITNESWHIVGRDLLSTSVRNFSLTGGPVAVYPNPFESSLQLEHEDWPGTLTFELFDQLGRQVFTADLLDSGSRVELPALPLGTYHYRLVQAQQLLQTGLLVKD